MGFCHAVIPLLGTRAHHGSDLIFSKEIVASKRVSASAAFLYDQTCETLRTCVPKEQLGVADPLDLQIFPEYLNGGFFQMQEAE